MKKLGKVLLVTCVLSIVSIVTVILWCNYIIKSQSENYIFSNISDVPTKKVGLVLGTSKYLQNGIPNYYFKYRIDAAAELYKNGKVQYFIVSGDNSRKDYNETEDMKLDLMAHGIPENHIYQDFAGFRTLDSVIRAEDIFGQKTFIIISQKFHNERAVYLARKNGLEAYGYNAQDVNAYAGLKTQFREYFARVKVFYDLLLGVEPKYSGDKVILSP
ncbi:SanA/YdcF family protein [Riemerella anatipestifer]|uniref:ElyC/SanA/YdcF family protein n=1 Tax=Riemerella anatipestifer TaxID=34085 RepID=A0AAP6HEX9_RIEAN|nr:ElyC/SanA/YdcF family protein [Riemerella anatipestifer]MBT0549028.1 YdcF family protein [Riemerella anatipestifer]MBT0555342.1 YdcF family protein [Riemerella anatipestifer]MBT0559791.1 YdcF family protein [Riemerella anatipestifer]MCO7354630.1 YdcF family protein [Riemerella anatipestifer]MCU7539878.1 YdcF family protein [Riemerella anatipestifer]